MAVTHIVYALLHLVDNTTTEVLVTVLLITYYSKINAVIIL